MPDCPPASTLGHENRKLSQLLALACAELEMGPGIQNKGLRQWTEGRAAKRAQTESRRLPTVPFKCHKCGLVGRWVLGAIIPPPGVPVPHKLCRKCENLGRGRRLVRRSIDDGVSRG